MPNAEFLLRCPVDVLGLSTFVPHRPLPLAPLPVSAPGGGRVAPQMPNAECRNGVHPSVSFADSSPTGELAGRCGHRPLQRNLEFGIE